MQVTEISASGLKREYRVVLPRRRSGFSPPGRARRHEGQGPHQRLPPRQGAAVAPEAPLRALHHGRGRAERRQRGQPQDRRGQQPPPRARAQDRPRLRPGGGGARHGGRGRPVLHGRGRDHPVLRHRLLRGPGAGAPGGRDLRRGDPALDRHARPGQPHLRAEGGRGRRRGLGRPPEGRLRGPHRRTCPSRAARARDAPAGARLETPSSPASRTVSSAPAPARSAAST